MKNISLFLFIKAREPGLLSITDGMFKSLVTVFGGTRIIDYYMTPSVLFKNIRVFVFTERGSTLKDYLVYTYNTGRIKIIDESDIFGALSRIAGGRKRGGFLFLQADGVLVADWAEIIGKLDTLSEGKYVFIAGGGRQFGFYISDGMVDPDAIVPVGKSTVQGDVDRAWETVSGHFTAGAKAIHFNARYLPLETVNEYFNTHIRLLDSLKESIRFFAAPGPAKKDESTTHIGNGGFVRNSHISSSCLIEGMVDHSVLFPGVRVGKGARIVNSIVMENNNIGEDAVVRNAILCGNNELFSKVAPNIGEKAVIGEDDTSGSNSEYPEYLRNGITLIGRNVEIPRKLRISRNCYIASNVDRAVLRGKGHIPAGSYVHAE